MIRPDGSREPKLHAAQGRKQQRYSACFTLDGGRLLAADNDSGRTVFTLWHLTGAAQESPAAQWLIDRPRIDFIWRITASNTHAAVIADPGLIGLFALSNSRHIRWIRTNAPVRDAAFAPSGRLLAVVGQMGRYLFAVHHDGPPGMN